MLDTAGEAGTNSLVMYSYGPPHMAVQKQDDQHEHTFSNYVMIRDVVQKTCQRRWTIGKSGERGPGIFVLPARHDDDDDNIYRKSVLVYNHTTWQKKITDNFDVIMCLFDSAQIIDFVGIYILDTLGRFLDSSNITLYRDDGFISIPNSNGPLTSKMKKNKLLEHGVKDRDLF